MTPAGLSLMHHPECIRHDGPTLAPQYLRDVMPLGDGCHLAYRWCTCCGGDGYYQLERCHP